MRSAVYPSFWLISLSSSNWACSFPESDFSMFLTIRHAKKKQHEVVKGLESY
jgi:hypothetical protein